MIEPTKPELSNVVKVEPQDLFVPDRFEALQNRAATRLTAIVLEVPTAIAELRKRERQMRAAGRGGFLLLRGDSGTGKTTLLNTANLFIASTITLSIRREESIESTLRQLQVADVDLRLIIIEGRDALRETTSPELESAIHAINSFVRSPRGAKTLVVWPVNADDLEHLLIQVSQRVGADSLISTTAPVFRFAGPDRGQFVNIATRTVATLNNGASLHDLGLTSERAEELAMQAPTIGSYLGKIRDQLIENEAHLDSLRETDRSRLWIIVAASNDPEGDVAALTQGTQSRADIDRLMSATGANIVGDLRKHPDKLGLLAHVLDARILHLPMVTALAIARRYGGSGRLHNLMTQQSLSTSAAPDALSRLTQSDIARAFRSEGMSTRARGPKPNSDTIARFKKLAAIASNDDKALNAAFAEALKASGFILDYTLEAKFGESRISDILVHDTTGSPIRLEMMWRSEAGRAGIANYSLLKLFNYAKAIRLID